MSIDIPTAYRSKITIPFGELKDVVEWVDRNCSGDVKYMEDPDDQFSSWVFFFESERDYIAFLMWKK